MSECAQIIPLLMLVVYNAVAVQLHMVIHNTCGVQGSSEQRPESVCMQLRNRAGTYRSMEVSDVSFEMHASTAVRSAGSI